jgi:uncharacterized SAM-binding protein YcdF (DUF218 family)
MDFKFGTTSFIVLCLGLLLAGAAGGIAGWPMVDSRLRQYLVRTDNPQKNATFDAVYIFGGGQEALKPKFELAAKLCKQGRTKTVLVLSRPGTTWYNATYGRNLTNDEWTMINLRRAGVPPNTVEMVSTGDGFFGTFSEVRRVTELAAGRGYERMALITSPHHTRRVWESLEWVKESKTRFFVLGSDFRCTPVELIREFGKLQLYRLVVFRD